MTPPCARRGLRVLRSVLAPLAHAQHTAMPAGMSHEQHMAQMKKDAEMKQHGNLAMGFDQDRTTHHFNLTADGGSIAVEANDPADGTSRDQIRAHLGEIAVAFGQGDFQKPFMTHSEVPPGVSAMQRLKGEITYTFEETARGGIVRIATAQRRSAGSGPRVPDLSDQRTRDGRSALTAEHPGHMPDHAAQKGDHTPGAQADHFGRHFDNAEEWAKDFDDPARDEWQLPSRVIDALKLTSGQLVADIGAGTGYFTVRLAKSPAAPTVYAVDIEPSMVEYVRQRAAREGLKNVVAVQAGADRTNLPEPVDLVLVVDTYHHIPNRVAYFTALKAHVKPGGRLAIVDFRKDSPSGPPVEFRFTPDQINAELASAGFSLQDEPRLPATPDLSDLRREVDVDQPRGDTPQAGPKASRS